MQMFGTSMPFLEQVTSNWCRVYENINMPIKIMIVLWGQLLLLIQNTACSNPV